MSGKEAEILLERIGVSTNKNMIPFDTRKPLDPSGIRFGTPAITTRGFDTEASKKLAGIMIQALQNPTDDSLIDTLKQQVRTLCIQYPLP